MLNWTSVPPPDLKARIWPSSEKFWLLMKVKAWLPETAVLASMAETSILSRPFSKSLMTSCEKKPIRLSLVDAPRGYAEFDAGAALKYVLNPNGYLS